MTDLPSSNPQGVPAVSYDLSNAALKYEYSAPVYISVPQVVFDEDGEDKTSDSSRDFNVIGSSSEEDPADTKKSEALSTSDKKYLMEDGHYTLYLGGEEQVETVLGSDSGFTCSHCGETFSRRVEILDHKRTVHNLDKFHRCPICMRSFTQRSNMKAHLRVHTGEKPFKCEYCGRCFAQKSNLMNHTPIHTKEKPYKCQLCEKHFIQKSNLKSHVLTHTGEKPYKCDLCNKCFIQKSNLVCHYRVHTQEKPHKCEVCFKLFSQKSNLLNHMKQHDPAIG